MKIRIKFQKSGVMKFVGHLDMMRYFQKAIRRADIDIAYSGGFSPHQIMSFASPLGVGVTSDGEYLDIEVHSTKSSRESVEALNRVGVEGICVRSYRKLPDHAKTAMSMVAAADYTITLRDERLPKDWMQKLSDFYAQNSIFILKKTKKSEKEINLKPLIYTLTAETFPYITMRLSSGSVDNVKPELVIRAFYQYLDMSMPESGMSIHRNELYARAEKEGEQMFVPLEELGEEIDE